MLADVWLNWDFMVAFEHLFQFSDSLIIDYKTDVKTHKRVFVRRITNT